MLSFCFFLSLVFRSSATFALVSAPESCCVTQDRFNLFSSSCLSFPNSWDHRCTPPCAVVDEVLGQVFRLLCMTSKELDVAMTGRTKQPSLTGQYGAWSAWAAEETVAPAATESVSGAYCDVLCPTRCMLAGCRRCSLQAGTLGTHWVENWDCRFCCWRRPHICLGPRF